MKVTVEKLPASQVGFKIEIEGKNSQEIYDRTLNKLTKSINVPGFRKGKAPRELLLRQIGKEKLKATVLEELIQTTLTEVTQERSDIQAIGSFDLGTSFEELFEVFTVGQPLEFKAAIDVHPVVQLNQYQNLHVQAEEVIPDLTEVDKSLHEFQVKRATLVPVEDRPVAMLDEVTIDFKLLNTSGEPIPEGTETDFQITVDKAEFLPDVIENLVGMNVGETKEISTVLPEDFFEPEYQGQPAIAVVTVTDLKFRELPALDDDFAKAISSKETIAELRTYLETQVTDRATAQAEENINRALINAVVEQMAEPELPSTMILRESERVAQQQIEWLTQTPEGEKLARQILNKEFVQNLVSTNEPEAIARIKKTLAIAEIARLEDITAPRLEVIDAATKLREEINDKSIDMELLKQVSEDDIVTTKVMAWLKENSQIEIVPAGTLTPPETDLEFMEGDDEDSDEYSQDIEAIEVEAIADQSEDTPNSDEA